jgi:hypothetical protein
LPDRIGSESKSPQIFTLPACAHHLDPGTGFAGRITQTSALYKQKTRSLQRVLSLILILNVNHSLNDAPSGARIS